MTAPVETSAPVETADTAAVDPTLATENVETKPEPEPVDTTAFDAAVEAVLAAVDQDEQGDRTDEVFAVRREYHEFDRSGKNVARKSVEERAQSAVMNGNLPQAQALLRLRDEMLKPLPSSGTARAPRVAKNRTEETVNAIAAITLAYSLSTIRAHADTELDSDWESRIQEVATAEAQDRTARYAAWLEAKQEGDEPEANEVEKAAARISLGRAPKGQGRKPKTAEERAAEQAAKEAEANAESIDPTNTPAE